MIDTTTEEYRHFKERDKVIVVYMDAKSKHMLNSAPDMICSLVDLEYFNSLKYRRKLTEHCKPAIIGKIKIIIKKKKEH